MGGRGGSPGLVLTHGPACRPLPAPPVPHSMQSEGSSHVHRQEWGLQTSDKDATKTHSQAGGWATAPLPLLCSSPAPKGQGGTYRGQDGRHMPSSQGLGPRPRPTEATCFPGAQRHLGLLGWAAWEEKQNGTFPQKQQARARQTHSHGRARSLSLSCPRGLCIPLPSWGALRDFPREKGVFRGQEAGTTILGGGDMGPWRAGTRVAESRPREGRRRPHGQLGRTQEGGVHPS